MVGRLAVLMAVTAVLTIGNAHAKEWTGNGFISINGGGQFGDRQFEANLAVPEFDEVAEYETDHALSGGGVLDVAGGLRVWRSLAFGVGFSVLQNTDVVVGSGTVPFLLNDQLGVGGFFRFAGGSVDLPIGNAMTSVDVGGAQLGGGLRLYF